jgi:hypothetical protein
LTISLGWLYIGWLYIGWLYTNFTLAAGSPRSLLYTIGSPIIAIYHWFRIKHFFIATNGLKSVYRAISHSRSTRTHSANFLHQEISNSPAHSNPACAWMFKWLCSFILYQLTIKTQQYISVHFSSRISTQTDRPICFRASLQQDSFFVSTNCYLQ